MSSGTIKGMLIDELRHATVRDAIAFVVIDEILVLYYTERDPSDPEWDAWIAQINRREHRAMLILTEGGAPNARQRAKMVRETDYGAALRPPMALLTDSMLLRGMMTAFAWLYGKAQPLRAFPRRRVDEAVAFLGVPVAPERVQAVLEVLSKKLSQRRPEKVAR
jgi:hypothetical protein